MIIRKAYKFKLKTKGESEQKLAQIAGCCRFVWNKALGLNLERLRNRQPILWYQEMAFWLVLWKQSEEMFFLKEAPSQALQQTLKSLDRAFKDGFEKKQPLKRLPRFKKKGQNNGFRYPQGFKVDEQNSRVYLPKIGWLRYRNSQKIKGQIKNISVSEQNGAWFVSIQSEQEVKTPQHPSKSIIGIDMGVAKFATLSDGQIYLPANSYRKKQKRLAVLQRQMSRKTKFSQNWKKAKKRVQKVHSKIAKIRQDQLHKTSTTISKNHAIIAIEDLKIKNMSKSAKGSIKKPGRKIRAKSGLNKSILDQGWFEFRRQLEYKQLWRGGQVLPVPAQNTSRRCASCGHTEAANRETQALFECQSCGHTTNADINAARNILAAGHAVIACGEPVLQDRSMKQAPPEAVLALA